MKKTSIFIVVIILVLILQGCAYFSKPKELPVIEDRLGEVNDDRLFGTLAITPERRIIFAKFDSRRFCAEPPPDVAENISSTLSAAIEASLDKGDVSAAAQARLAQEFISTVDQIFTRTQGVQLFRDGIYSLCQAYANEAIDKDLLWSKYDELLKISTLLIQMELGKLPSPDTQAAKQAADQAKQALSETIAAKNEANRAKEAAQKALNDLKLETNKEIK